MTRIRLLPGDKLWSSNGNLVPKIDNRSGTKHEFEISVRFKFHVALETSHVQESSWALLTMCSRFRVGCCCERKSCKIKFIRCQSRCSTYRALLDVLQTHLNEVLANDE